MLRNAIDIISQLVLYCIAWNGTVSYLIALHCVALCCIAVSWMVWYGIVT